MLFPDVPAPHAVHPTVFPTFVLNVPTGHGSHVACPVRELNHPAGHDTHVFCAASGCTVPAAHGSHLQL